MTEKEKIKQIEALYAEALAKIKALEAEQKEIAGKANKDIINKAIEALRSQLTS